LKDKKGRFSVRIEKGGFIFAEEIPFEAVALVEAMARILGIDDAGFDIAALDGRFCYFEFNHLLGTAGLI
jgi:ribosomal protein S6--L-glutamate ligase